MSEETRMRAGDYVLGLMDEAETIAAEHAMAIEPAFRDEVLSLAERLGALDASVAPIEPGEALRARVLAIPAGASQLSPSEAISDALAAAGHPVPGGEPRHGILRLRRPMSGFFQGARGTALAASLIAALALGYVVGQASVATQDPRAVAVLSGEGQAPVVVEAYGDDRIRILPLGDIDVPAGSVLQVWTLYDQAVGPVSLGTLTEGRETMLAGPSLPPPQDGQLYEISLEQAPGSTAGRPLGPVLLIGHASLPPR